MVTCGLAWRTAVLALGLTIALTVGSAGAQEVGWSLSERLAQGQRGTLDLVFTDCAPVGRVELPKVEGLNILGSPSESRSFSFQNFEQTASTTLGFGVVPQKPGELLIPSFEVETDEGKMRVPATTLSVGTVALPGAGGTSASLEESVETRLEFSTNRPYVGEVIELELILLVSAGQRAELIGGPIWQPSGLIVSDWSAAESIRSGARHGVRYRARAVALEAGPLAVPGIDHELGLYTGRRSGRGLFQRREVIQVVTRTAEQTLQVRPLAEGAPDGFEGAVGQFEIESTVVPNSASVGEPITWTLELRGTGNWPSGVSLPSRGVPADLRVIQPGADHQFAEGELFSGAVSEDLVLIPTRPGSLALEPVRFWFFNPQSGEYELARVPGKRLEISPTTVVDRTATEGVPPELRGTAVTGDEGQATEAGSARFRSLDGVEVVEPPLPTLLRSPIATSGGFPLVGAPLHAGTASVLAALPLLLLVAFAAGLARSHARRTDPLRSRHAAIASMRVALDEIESATDASARRAGLVAWQGQIGVVLGLPDLVPSLAMVHARVEGAGSDPVEGVSADWEALYDESLRSLYAPGASIAPDFVARARAAIDALRIPVPGLFAALRPRDILPSPVSKGLAVLLISMASAALTVPLTVRAASDVTGIEAYEAGDLVAARSSFSEQIEVDPSDPALRYNLALVYSREGDALRALAAQVSAFLLAPRHEAVRWNLERIVQEAAPIDRSLATILGQGARSRAARWASPLEWQLIGCLGVALLAASLGVVLRARHRARWGRASGISLAMAAAGLLLIAASASGLERYGPLSDPDAVFVIEEAPLRNVPTDSALPRGEVGLHAGEVGRRLRNFLGWSEFARSNGERGWVRRTSLVPLYGAPDRPAPPRVPESENRAAT